MILLSYINTKDTKDLNDLSHEELVTAFSNVPELVDALPSLASRAFLTGRLLFMKDNVEKLQTIGLEDPDVAKIFLEHYLQPWIRGGVPTSLLTCATSSSPSLSTTPSESVSIIIIVIT